MHRLIATSRWALAVGVLLTLPVMLAGCTPSSAHAYEQHLSITIAPLDQPSTGLRVSSANR